MRIFLRLDLERMRHNLQQSTGTPHTEEDVLRHLAGVGVWRKNDDWWAAGPETLDRFGEGEVLERRGADDGGPTVGSTLLFLASAVVGA
jgi:hypothetical protein